MIDQHADSIWADDALFMLAELLEQKMQDPDEAKALYQQLLERYPDSLYHTEARKRFRNLRGDHLGT
ncbi:Tetratricopeptide repeat protein [compost metagenome]